MSTGRDADPASSRPRFWWDSWWCRALVGTAVLIAWWMCVPIAVTATRAAWLAAPDSWAVAGLGLLTVVVTALLGVLSVWRTPSGKSWLPGWSLTILAIVGGAFGLLYFVLSGANPVAYSSTPGEITLLGHLDPWMATPYFFAPVLLLLYAAYDRIWQPTLRRAAITASTIAAVPNLAATLLLLCIPAIRDATH